MGPGEVGRQRLSMILVADRCGLSPGSLMEMKRNTVRALSDCMDMDELQVGIGGKRWGAKFGETSLSSME